MDNADIARVLDEVADLLDVLGQNPFRVRAYHAAARTIETLAEPAEKIVVRDAKALCDLPGIAKDLAGKIAEMVKNGDFALHKDLLGKVPASLTTMMRVSGVGPKRAKLLYDELGIRTLDELETAAAGGKLRVRGIGEVLERRILQGCREQKARTGRFKLSEADAHAASLVAYLQQCTHAQRVAVAGSLRRRKETIGDIDLLVASSQPAAVVEHFLRCPDIAGVLAHGETKCSAALRSGMQVDVRIVEPHAWGAALHYFTGAKEHNIAVRKLGLKRKLKINEYGVFRGARRVAGRTEEEVYAAVGLPWIAPELREEQGEIDAARAGTLPRLVELSDIRGNVHVHTDATDGTESLRDMVEACARRGFEYVVITDHTRALRMSGLDATALRRQRRAIDALRRHVDIDVLHGAEVDILEDGRLDLEDDVLRELDLVIAAVHSKLDMSEASMTARVLRALENPHVHVLAHPTGRLIGARDPSKVDLAKVVASARDHGVLLEINSQPDRFDLPPAAIRMARDSGVRLVVSTDAHRAAELDLVRYGVDQARRGWCSADDVANTRSAEEFRRLLRAEPVTRGARASGARRRS